MQSVSPRSVCVARPARLLIVLAIAAAGCGGPPPVPKPKYDPEGIAKAAMEEYDKNGDGKLDGAELEACPSLKDALFNMQLSGEKKTYLVEDDIAERLRLFQQSNIGLCGVRCTVTRGRELVSGVTVTFMPEKFMGGAVQPGTGVTDKKGIASPLVEGKDIDGVSLGYYRLELSLKDTSGKETLPAKYNTNTVYGVEVHHRKIRPIVVDLE